MNLTNARLLYSTMCSKFYTLSLLKIIVNFYYKKLFFNPNTLKYQENMPIYITEHKNCLELIKAVSNSNIDFIY